MDWTPVEQAAISAAALIISASAAVAATYIRSHTKNQALAAVETKAVTIGAGIAASALQASVAKGAPSWVAARDAALATGTAAAQDVLATVTPTQVEAGLATLLTPDPTVPAGSASTAVATAQPGATAAALAEPVAA